MSGYPRDVIWRSKYTSFKGEIRTYRTSARMPLKQERKQPSPNAYDRNEDFKIITGDALRDRIRKEESAIFARFEIS